MLHFQALFSRLSSFTPRYFSPLHRYLPPLSHLRASMNVSWSECTALYRENAFSIGSSWTSNARELFRSFSTIFEHDTTKYLFPSRRNGSSTFPDARRHSPNFSLFSLFLSLSSQLLLPPLFPSSIPPSPFSLHHPVSLSSHSWGDRVPTYELCNSVKTRRYPAQAHKGRII